MGTHMVRGEGIWVKALHRVTYTAEADTSATERGCHCNGWHRPCGLWPSTRQDAQGKVHRSYEAEALAIFLMETVLGSNVPVYYTYGEEIVKGG
ncbi:hypothetical protein MBOU_50860 [Mycobacterium bourgelatii]|uniref:Uncharacterized protein n=1 Tax=Mycobacterium bourgelatii TaxID=1273442 RepID=A0A7I9YWE8_MYCBU|nr:hypothetical protein MBOU_50860 [Mycobacterium bourgelatii]